MINVISSIYVSNINDIKSSYHKLFTIFQKLERNFNRKYKFKQFFK